MAFPAKTFDYVIVGAGIVGTNIAHALRIRFPKASIAVIDKEAELGAHASGRNSGVLHSGVYYSAGSLKAKLTARGNAFLTEFCTRKNIPLNRCGKLIVARHEGELAGLETLANRAVVNGVHVEEIDEQKAKQLEPLARTHKRALWSPATSVANPLHVLSAQVEDVRAAGVQVHMGVSATAIHPAGHASLGAHHMCITLQDGTSMHAGHVINCAGLYADKLAHMCGFALGLELLPFKGLYLYCTLPLTRLVYPVPDLSQPFLGVHFTVTADGKCKIGPTAIPAFWREQYGDTSVWAGFNPGEASRILAMEAGMFLSKPGFRRLAMQEMAKYSRSRMAAGAAELVPTATIDTFTTYGRAGIRPQLVRRADMELVQDYVLVGDAHSTHVLNAISPAWTCARPFAELVVQDMVRGQVPKVSLHELAVVGTDQRVAAGS